MSNGTQERKRPSSFSRNLFLQSPFGLNPSGTGPILITIGSFTDGTSQTHVASELLQGAPDDIRGTLWSPNPGGASYMTRFTPNGYQDYVTRFQPWASSVSASALVFKTRTTCRAFTARITAPAHPTRARCAIVNRLAA